MTPAEAYEELPNYMEKHGMQYKMLSARQARCNANRCDHCSDCPFRDRINPSILIDGSYQKITIFLHVPNKERFIAKDLSV